MDVKLYITFLLLPFIHISSAFSGSLSPAVFSELMSAVQSDSAILQTSILEKTIVLDPWVGLVGPSAESVFTQYSTQTIQANWISNLSGQSISDQYTYFINSANWGRRILSEKEERLFQNAESQLFDNDQIPIVQSVQYKRFIESRKDYRDLKEIWDTTPEDERTLTQRKRLRRAKEIMEVDNNGIELTSYESEIARYMSSDSNNSVFKYIKSIYEANLDDTGSPITRIYPRTSPFEIKWTRREIDIPDISILANSEYEYTPELLRSFWIKSQDETTDLPVAFYKLSIEFEFTTIDINRPWLEVNRFSDNRNWRLSTAEKISSGALQRNLEDTQGSLTLIPKSLLLVRNIVMTAGFSNEFYSHIINAGSNDISMGVGPLTISGSYSSSDGSVKNVTAFPYGANSIYIPHVQILGFHSEIIKETPDLDVETIFDDPILAYPLDEGK